MRLILVQVALLNRTIVVEDPDEHIRTLIKTHFRPVLRAVLRGIAGGAPTSTAQNLVDLLLALVSRDLEDCKVWVPEILFSDAEFVNSRASREDKEKFAKAVLACVYLLPLFSNNVMLTSWM